MKANKFMLAGMLVAALAMVGCEPKEPVTNPDQGGEEPIEVEVPVINTPGAGKTTIAIYVPEDTPRGAYLVGSFNNYTISDDSVSFTKVDGEERWYAATIDVEPSLLVKAIARPSDESVALAWSYQWGMNIDPEDKDCKVTEDHVILLQGAEAGSLVFENGGEVKLSITADDAVIFIEVKEWKTTPVIPDVPAATAWMKHPFDGSNWVWKEMTKTTDATFTLAARFGGKGCNIAETEGGAENYYETITVEEGSEAPAKGDSVLFTFVSTKGNVGTVSMKLIEKGAYVPVPAGNGKFIVTLSDYTPVDGDQIIFTGNFTDKAWDASDRVMTAEADGTYSWTGDYPEDFQFKVILVRDGKQNWAKEDNVTFDGENYTATFTFGL